VIDALGSGLAARGPLELPPTGYPRRHRVWPGAPPAMCGSLRCTAARHLGGQRMAGYGGGCRSIAKPYRLQPVSSSGSDRQDEHSLMAWSAVDERQPTSIINSEGWFRSARSADRLSVHAPLVGAATMAASYRPTGPPCVFIHALPMQDLLSPASTPCAAAVAAATGTPDGVRNHDASGCRPALVRLHGFVIARRTT